MYTIAMDLDGVLYPFDKVFLQLYKKHGGGTDVVFDKWVDFSTLEEGAVTKVWRDPGLFFLGDPIPGAIETMKALHEMPGVKVVITTSFGRVPDIVVPAKWRWVQTWMPWFEGFDFITVHHKWLIAADMLVDDFHNNVEEWMKKHPGGTGVLVQRPWNESKVERLAKRGVLVATNGVEDILPWVDEAVFMKKCAKGA